MSTQLSPTARNLLRWEIAIVLAITFGASAVRSILTLTEVFLSGSLTAQPLALNASYSDNPLFDVLFHTIRIITLLAWGGLVWLLLAKDGVQGIPGRLTWPGLGWGAGLAALIGIPGLGLYITGVLLGFGRPIDPSAMGVTLGTALPLLGWAAANAFAEELVVVGWLVVRLKQLGWSPVAIIAASSLLRGGYHLYQGVGGGIGNLIMGVIFTWFYLRTGKLWPLIAAHFLIDAVAFLGYPLAEPWLNGLFG